MDADACHSNSNGAGDHSVPRVLVTDSSRAFAEGVVVLLQAEGISARLADLDHLAEAFADGPFATLIIDGASAQQLASDGLAQIRHQHPGCHLLLVVDNLREGADRVVELTGARTWVSRHSEAETLIATVRSLHERSVHPDVERRFATPPRAGGTQSFGTQLTDREHRVLGLISQGLSNEAIGQTLDISPNTVRSHVRNVLIKLNVHSRAEAVAMAVQPNMRGSDGGSVDRAVSW